MSSSTSIHHEPHLIQGRKRVSDEDLLAEGFKKLRINMDHHPDQLVYPKASLAGMPPEILERIMSFVIAHQTIHIDYVERKHRSESLCGTGSQLALQQSICQDNGEFGIFRHEKCSRTVGIQSVRTFPGFDALPQRPRIRDNSKAAIKRIPHDKRLHLDILLANKQTYTTGLCILWKTNTFYFENPIAFHAFMCALTPLQRGAIAKLTIVHIDDNMDTRTSFWANALEPELVRSCVSIQTLGLEMLLGYNYHHRRANGTMRIPRAALGGMREFPVPNFIMSLSTNSKIRDWLIWEDQDQEPEDWQNRTYMLSLGGVGLRAEAIPNVETLPY